MNPIEMLKHEHRVIERVLDALESWAHVVAHESQDDRDELARFAELFSEFADACHHGKEEKILFREMIDHGFSPDEGPVSVMLQEHREGRKLVAALAQLASSASSWSDSQRAELLATVRSYCALLREHIRKEDGVLYPMAESRLKDLQKALEERFERFEAEETGSGEHERLHALGDALIQRHSAEGGLHHAHE